MKLLLLGDISATELTTPLFKAKDTNTLFTDTKTLFDKSDFSVINLECAITDSTNEIKKIGPNLKTPYETAAVLKDLGVDCCGISNNHIFDFGIEGVLDTYKALNDVGLDYTGFGENYEEARKNYIINKNGEKIAIIAVCEHEYSYALFDRMGARPFDEFDTLEDIRNAKKENDRVVVMYHGGKEHCAYPSPRLRKACRAMVKSGADIILCQHSHCIVSYEEFQNGHILYGQGNFQFCKTHENEGWHSSLAVMYDTEKNEVEFTPIICDGPSIKIAKGSDAEKIMGGFLKRNKELFTDEWKKGWHEFCESMIGQYHWALKNAGQPDATEKDNQLFGHYLDCEAHSDVWRELYPTYNLTNEK